MNNPTVLEIILDIRANNFHEKDKKLTPNMINPNIKEKKIYFATTFKYSKTLLKDAELGNTLETFTNINNFKTLYAYATETNELRLTKKQKNKAATEYNAISRNYDIPDSVREMKRRKLEKLEVKLRRLEKKFNEEKPNIIIHNAKYMIDLMFKENNKLYINNIEYQISSIKPEETEGDREIKLNIEIYVTSSLSAKNIISRNRLECKYKKQALLEKFKETSDFLSKYIPIRYEAWIP